MIKVVDPDEGRDPESRRTEALSRRKLSDLVEERLLTQIQDGAMRPGDTLPSERELMARFEVGRPAIREAMQSLQRKGLIEIRHGERPRVAEPSFDRTVSALSETMRHMLLHTENTLDHLKEARALFEVQMAGIAAGARTEADIAELAAVVAAHAEAPPGSEAFLRLDGAFHQTIAGISGNPIFRSLSGALFGWLSEFHRDLVHSPGHENVTLAEHRGILAAIAAGDRALAMDRMRDHLARADAAYRSGHFGQS